MVMAAFAGEVPEYSTVEDTGSSYEELISFNKKMHQRRPQCYEETDGLFPGDAAAGNQTLMELAVPPETIMDSGIPQDNAGQLLMEPPRAEIIPGVGTKPNFDYLDLYDKGCKRWTEYITPLAQQLSQVLWEHCSPEHWKAHNKCMICEVTFPVHMASHLWSKAHNKKLKERLNWEEPKCPSELTLYTQCWPIEKHQHPWYFFNHVTGNQGFCPEPPPGAFIAQVIPNDPLVDAGVAPATPIESRCADATSTVESPTRFAPGEHNQISFMDALCDKGKWRMHMTETARRLEDELYKLTGRWLFACKVCEKDMVRGIKDHVASKDHWNKLWVRLGNGENIPSPDIADDWQKSWVQEFETSQGPYLFNHITGKHRYKDVEIANTGCLSDLAPPGPAPSPASLQSPALGGLQTVAPPHLASSAGSIVGSQPPSRGGVTFARALESPQDWNKYIDEPAKELQWFIQDYMPSRLNEPCIVCDCSMAGPGGLWMHIASPKHFSQIKTRLKGGVPSSANATDWNSPWVEVINVFRGQSFQEYLFNHLTGEQGFRQALTNSATGAGAVAAPPPQIAAPPPQMAPAPPPPSPIVQPSIPSSNNTNGDPCDLDLWMFQKVIEGPARELSQHLRGEMSVGRQLICDVCQVHMKDVFDHIHSLEHYACLRRRMNCKAPALNRISSGPWVQKGFRLDPVGPIVSGVCFNHVTGEISGNAEFVVPSWPEMQ